MDPANDKFTKLIQEMDDFKNKFSPNPDARLSTGNGPHQDHLQVPSSGAAEAMITDSPILTEAEHCSHITAAQTQLKDREKAVDMMRQIIKHQGVLIDEGLMKPTAMKPTLEGLKKAEDALAETTKRCLMDLANANPSHSHIILQAFGLAKDKMRSSQNKFDMSFHLFAAYTHVISTSEFCTA
ncbi:hypothetical protein CDAR_83721 [Caerostris darwini]|uniref:Uncharacterized protein n=2 Tax=Caerostris darwini TaxID=1538125 RepID=A0AAV4UKL3_9ARAC|nr:hypothetical protein CDAR_83721 [Caerostris darwini]